MPSFRFIEEVHGTRISIVEADNYKEALELWEAGEVDTHDIDIEQATLIRVEQDGATIERTDDDR